MGAERLKATDKTRGGKNGSPAPKRSIKDFFGSSPKKVQGGGWDVPHVCKTSNPDAKTCLIATKETTVFVQASKRSRSPDEDPRGKRQRATEDEDEDERLAEEKLRQLQELAERASSTKHSALSSSSSSSAACSQSQWEQIGNLLLYTAAGVKGRNKVSLTTCFLTVLFLQYGHVQVYKSLVLS